MSTADLTTALTQLAGRRDQYALYQDYYDGEHRLAFATDKFRSAFGTLFQAFADNLCPAIVDAVCDRLVVTGFQVEGALNDADPRIPQLPELGITPVEAAPVAPPIPRPGAAPAAEDLDADIAADAAAQNPADLAWDLWTSNHMDLLAGEVYQEAGVAGDAYVIVWPDPDTGTPQFDPQPAAQCTVRYDPEQRRRVLWGAKVWAADDGVVRANLYYADRIEKYVTRQSVKGEIPLDARGFVPFEVAGETWPLKNLWGVCPLFHFANNARLGTFGRSDLKDVIPLQDALNKAVCDMLVAMEFTAFPQRWITGLEVEKDEVTGRPVAPFVPGEDRIWAVGDKDVHFGEFPAAGLSNYLDVQESLRAEIGRVSGTPAHYLMLITGRWPSGEALRISEIRLTQKCLDRALAYGVTWGAAFTLALRMLKVDGTVVPQWQDPAPVSALDQIAVLLGEQKLGVPEAALWKARGYTDTEIAQMRQMHQAASLQAIQLTAQAAAAQAAALPAESPPEGVPV